MYRKLRFDKRTRDGITKLSGAWKIGEGGRLCPANPKGGRNIPWVFTHQDTRKKYCSHWNNTYCLTFNHIPTYCRFNCWKVVIKPRNVKETFLCHDIMREIHHPGKIGMDLRTYTFGAWAGFLYCESLTQGREIWAIAREKIPDEIPVILKRGCTEMERMTPSSLWDIVTREEAEFEEHLNDIFDFSELNFTQADWLHAEIKERWIEHAIQIGDPTAREMAEKLSGDPDIWNKLIVHSLTYHDSDPRDALKEAIAAKKKEVEDDKKDSGD